jgi:hypothetical protein
VRFNSGLFTHVRATPQWFADVEGVKTRANAALQAITFHPVICKSDRVASDRIQLVIGLSPSSPPDPNGVSHDNEAGECPYQSYSIAMVNPSLSFWNIPYKCWTSEVSSIGGRAQSKTSCQGNIKGRPCEKESIHWTCGLIVAQLGHRLKVVVSARAQIFVWKARISTEDGSNHLF